MKGDIANMTNDIVLRPSYWASVSGGTVYGATNGILHRKNNCAVLSAERGCIPYGKSFVEIE